MRTILRPVPLSCFSIVSNAIGNICALCINMNKIAWKLFECVSWNRSMRMTLYRIIQMEFFGERFDFRLLMFVVMVLLSHVDLSTCTVDCSFLCIESMNNCCMISFRPNTTTLIESVSMIMTCLIIAECLRDYVQTIT